MVYDAAQGWIKGVFIIVALFIQILITAGNDYQKDSKFIKLQAKNKTEEVTVIRGKAGQKQTIKNWDIVSGDVIMLNPGDKVPADCLVVQSANLKVKEPTRHDDPDSEVTSISWQELFKI